MLSRTRSRAGSATRTVVVLVLALGMLALVLWRLVVPPPPITDAERAAGAAGEERAPAVLVSEESARARLDGQGLAGARANATAVGVRLAGPAKLDGRVLERASGLGVGGVRVALLPVPPSGATFFGRMLRIAGLAEMASRTKPIAVAVTAPDGAFHFDGVRRGTWYVDARGPYHVPENVVRARLLATGGGGPLDVWVRGGGRVVGRVLLPDGRAAANVTAELVPGPGSFIERARTGELVMAEQKTDENGAFVFEAVAPGPGYEVTAAGSGFALTHALDVRVKAGEDTLVTVQTRAGGSVTGRVVSGPKSAPGEEVATTPLAGAQLGAVPRGLRDLRCAEELLETTHCVSAADGSFTMLNVPAGEIDLVAIAPGHLPALGARIAVADGANATTPDLVLHPGPLVKGRVVDAAGAPVAGAEVRWNMVDWQNFQFDFSLAPMMAQAVKGFSYPTTDEDGRFEAGPFAGTAPFGIDFTKLGYQDARHEWKPDVEKGELTVTMHRGGSLEGIVMDEAAAEPVTTFTIATTDRVDSEPSAPGARNPFTGGTTFEDESGRFVLDSLEPGKVRLVVSSPGYLERVVDDVVVREGAPTKGVIVKLAPGGTIRGVVVDPNEQPVPGAQVAAFPSGGDVLANTPATRMRNERRAGRMGPRMPFEQLVGDMPPGMTNYFASLGLLGDKAVLTDASGAFELRGVAPGEVRVLAFHREFASGNSGPLTLAVETPLTGVKIVMNSGGGIEGKVVDRHGRAVPGSIVVALSPLAMGGGGRGPAGDASGGALYQGESSANGEYKIRHVAAGSYILVATRGDEALNPASFFGNLNFDIVNVPPGQTVNYDVVDSSAGGCRVYGTITCNGAPVERGTLTAVTFESESTLGIDFKAARVKDGGAFEFPGLAPGEYQLNLDGNGAQVRMRLEVPDELEFRADLHCPEGGAEGVVRDAASGAGVKGVDVALRPIERGPKPGGFLGSLIASEGQSFRATTKENGEFRIERLPAGEYELVARPRGEAKKTYAPGDVARVRIDEDRVTRGLEVKLPAALALAGIVRDGGGSPVAGARVLARAAGDERAGLERAETDADGRFELRGLAPGRYELRAAHDGFADAVQKDVELARNAVRRDDVVLVLEKGVEVTAVVYGNDGRPAAGARARLVRKGAGSTDDVADAGRAIEGLFTGAGTTDADGRVVVGRFAPGEYRLEVQRASARTTVPDVKIPGNTTEFEVRAELP